MISIRFKTIRVLVTAAGILALTSCTSNVETQHDGSGSDVMLKSPCACSQVPYDAPSYRWGRV